MNIDNRLIVKTNLKRYRLIASEFTQKDVALQCGIPLRTYQSYEQGERLIKNAKAEYITAIARLYNLDVNCIGLIL